jgi:soluble lytic murein transglycosylase-like protein
VQKVKPSRRAKLNRKATSWALGGVLALGGLGIPLKLFSSHDQPSTGAAKREPGATAVDIRKDLETARAIASQVQGGVKAAVQDVAHVASDVPTAAASGPTAVVSVARVAAETVAETVREHFFRTQVPFGQLIYKEAQKNSIAPELLAAVVHVESKSVPNARSHAGAVGLMQLVPRTGRWLGARDLANPQQNVTAGAKYLRYLTDRFNGNTRKAIAAYNAGEGNVRRFGGVPPFSETRSYVNRVRDYQSELGQRIAGHEVTELR